MTKHLDEIVCDGIKSGELLIPQTYAEQALAVA
jgi:hypothetical protein